MMEVWTQASRFIWCPLTRRWQLTQHSHRVRFWHLTTVPMARLHDSQSNDWESTSLSSWFLHMTLLSQEKNKTKQKTCFQIFLCNFVILFRVPNANVHFLSGRKKNKTVCHVNVSDDAYICMQIVLRALQPEQNLTAALFSWSRITNSQFITPDRKQRPMRDWCTPVRMHIPLFLCLFQWLYGR